MFAISFFEKCSLLTKSLTGMSCTFFTALGNMVERIQRHDLAIQALVINPIIGLCSSTTCQEWVFHTHTMRRS